MSYHLLDLSLREETSIPDNSRPNSLDVRINVKQKDVKENSKGQREEQRYL